MNKAALHVFIVWLSLKGSHDMRLILTKGSDNVRLANRLIFDTKVIWNGLFYLNEIFYSENSPYLYDIDTFSELQPSRVPFMANGRGSGKRANR